MANRIYTAEEPDRFQKVSKEIIRDINVDILTLGVYTRLLVLSKEWDINVKGLGTIFRSGGYVISDDKIRKCLVKLEELGYLRRVIDKDDNNRILGWDYILYSEPVPIEERTHAGKKDKFPCSQESYNTEILQHGNPTTRKEGNINIKTLIKQENIQEKEIVIKKKKGFVKPTVDEVRAYCQERRNRIDPQRFFDFYEMKGWMVGKSPMKDWKAAVRTWEGKDNRGPQPVAPAPRPIPKDVDQRLNALYIENMYKQ